MTRSIRRSTSAHLLATAATIATIAGCAPATRHSSAGRASPASAADPNLSPAARAQADGGRPPYTKADVQFMQGMIGHHAQAVTMARWAPSHGASNELRILAERIDVAQRDEITFMQRWLRERGETVPDTAAAHEHEGHAGMDMPGMDMSAALMPGMLTPEQMTQLSRARGAEFDRLFLTFMIQHHEGALVMVDRLFGSRGAGQDDAVFKFASDVSADQSTEIDRMRSMRAARAR
jgi:uncharacterized protein (DUF305 family)